MSTSKCQHRFFNCVLLKLKPQALFSPRSVSQTLFSPHDFPSQLLSPLTTITIVSAVTIIVQHYHRRVLLSCYRQPLCGFLASHNPLSPFFPSFLASCHSSLIVVVSGYMQYLQLLEELSFATAMSKLKFKHHLDSDIVDFEVLASLVIVVCLIEMVVLAGTFGTNVVNIAMLNLYYVMLR